MSIPSIVTMDTPLMPKEGSEDYWRAQNDARTLTESEAIKADDKRRRMALAVLQKDNEAREKALASLKKKGSEDEENDEE